MHILCIAEKPSIAETIAQVLAKEAHKPLHTRKGIATPVHEFEAFWPWKGSQNATYKITSVTGHVYNADFPTQMQNWGAVLPEELFSAPIFKNPTSTAICKHIQNESKGIHAVVLWLDCDREGENICFEVLQNIGSSISENDHRVFRAKFSSITHADILSAMQKLGKPNLNESLSVDARQEIDLKVGVAFSRFQTKFFLEKYGNINTKLISYGPCQIPTLSFCVQRHDEIQTFISEPFWKIVLQIKNENIGSSANITCHWNRVKTFDKKIGMLFAEMLKKETYAKVISVKQKLKSLPRPLPLNTVSLLRAASSGLGIGPQSAMRIAEHLYLQGYISYPRTETTSYPNDFDFSSVLRELSRNSAFGAYASSLSDTYNKGKKGVDVGDHPPITPVKSAEHGELSGDSWRMYDYITRTFLGSISSDAKAKSTTLEFQVASEIFYTDGQILVSKGHLEIMPWLESSDVELPELKEGQMCHINSVTLKESQTEPPSHLTESELIGLMEKHGIGTDASISTHIANIIDRNYVRVGNGRTLIPNDLGIVLIHGYMQIDPELALPSLRAYIEKQVTLIAQGKATLQDVVSYALGIFLKKFSYFKSKINKMDLLFESHFASVEKTQGRFLSRCGKCRRMMKYIALKPARLYCANCEEIYKLPQNGKMSLYMEKKCPFDDFEILRYSTGTGSSGISYFVCPFCYNYPPFENMPQGNAFGFFCILKFFI
jgi:DNA topoisomerase-3